VGKGCSTHTFPFSISLQYRLNITALYLTRNKPLRKQQFVVTWRYTILQQTEKKTWQFINRPALKHVIFYENMSFFCGCNTGRRCACNPGISVWRIVRVTTNCCFMSGILSETRRMLDQDMEMTSSALKCAHLVRPRNTKNLYSKLPKTMFIQFLPYYRFPDWKYSVLNWNTAYSRTNGMQTTLYFARVTQRRLNSTGWLWWQNAPYARRHDWRFASHAAANNLTAQYRQFIGTTFKEYFNHLFTTCSTYL